MHVMVTDIQSTVRVRFAPSPTGFPHVGNIRTALFNWLFARHSGGKFILRIEDTDTARRVEGAVEAIMDGLTWMGLDWDEGPIFQSDRLPLYRQEAERLVKNGYAYYCFCSPERLERVRQDQSRQHIPPRYDGHCRQLSADEVASRLAAGEPGVIRFKTPTEGDTSFHDLIRGEVTFSNAILNDYVLLKSDGYPTYHLANVVDDHYMNITHIMRADEWISSTPLHAMLYQSFAWQPPSFAHLPMILGPDKSKLSKRHGATTIIEYREKGYLPEAVVNFLALLGWSLDDKTELLSRAELVANFSLERVGKTAAVFDIPKLDWMNGTYIRALEPAEFAQRALRFLERDLPAEVKRPLDEHYVSNVARLVQERTRVLSELGELCGFFFAEELSYPASLLLVKGLDASTATAVLKQVVSAVNDLAAWQVAALEAGIRPLAEVPGLSTKLVFGLLRVAVTGKTATPPLFETMEVLGPERCLHRLRAAIAVLEPFTQEQTK